VLIAAEMVGPSSQVGETLSPGVLPLLGYLGVEKHFEELGQLPAGGTSSAWGTKLLEERLYLYSGRGNGWHLDRRRFDKCLIDCAEAAGVSRIRHDARGAERASSYWTIACDGGHAVEAQHLVDTSGRRAWLARRYGGAPLRDDALIAESRWYTHSEAERFASGALIESTSGGWWYSATLPKARAVAMLLTDSDLRRNVRWDEELRVAPWTLSRLSQWRATGETALRAAHSQRTAAVVGNGWVAAGDAALAFDPIASLGIGFALRSGMEAARVAAAGLESDSETAQSYSKSIADIYREYRGRLRVIYRQERRWPDADFWKRRREITFEDYSR
jgi:flavin-dependent dehydrogenase